MSHFRTISKTETEENLIKSKKGNSHNLHILKIENKDHKQDKQEIGSQAVWSLSSAKPGFGVDQIRDNNLETFWQYPTIYFYSDYLKDQMELNRIL
jgi:hypothetical protein